MRSGFFTDEERAVYPPVQHGRRALFLGAHASHVVGLPIDEGRALLKEILAHVTQPRFCYRCILHRATPFDSARHKRLLQRTTISGDPAELPA